MGVDAGTEEGGDMWHHLFSCRWQCYPSRLDVPGKVTKAQIK